MINKFLKRFMLVLAVMLIISSFSTVSADRAYTSIMAVENGETVEPAENVQQEKFGYKNIYRTIILRYENNPTLEDDDVVSYITPVVARITYKYYATWSTTQNRYVGGYFALSSVWPRYEVIPHNTYELDVSFSNKNHPVNCSVTGNDAQQYIANAAGGTYQITYNKELVFDQYGQLKNVIPQTDTLVHSFTYTGGTASN